VLCIALSQLKLLARVWNYVMIPRAQKAISMLSHFSVSYQICDVFIWVVSSLYRLMKCCSLPIIMHDLPRIVGLVEVYTNYD
jgi:hypothetical protein